MPELPEVHTLLEELKNEKIIGQSIIKANVYWPRSIAIPTVEEFSKIILNKKILGLSRRGKYLIINLNDNYDLMIHLRMSGRLILSTNEPEELTYIRLSLILNDSRQLNFHDTRKFGRCYLVKSNSNFFEKLGPEPLDSTFTPSLLQKMLQKKSRGLKPLLLDQSFIAGLGNIYVDEALWDAKLHPLRKSNTLSKNEVTQLHTSIQHVLNRGLQSGGTTLGTGRSNFYRLSGEKGNHQSLLKVFRQTGKECPRCNHIIERIKVAQRSTHICRNCQKI
ncbi:MAG: DNA-formamidopyrimidine glycosylase [Parachlamydiaceae bacterium]|nr:DNA-formamidopyrimidine glycosylase [Parachlamydiaceae bacterium]